MQKNFHITPVDVDYKASQWNTPPKVAREFHMANAVSLKT